jgi:hypothetical protein
VGSIEIRDKGDSRKTGNFHHEINNESVESGNTTHLRRDSQHQNRETGGIESG